MAVDVSEPRPLQASSSPVLLTRKGTREFGERVIETLMFLAAGLTVLTTFGIVASLIVDAIPFFRQVSLVEFLTGTQWTPLFSTKKFGILPLVVGTLLTSFIGLLVAVPFGLAAAIFLSEFASPRVRNVVKPLLEILAGIPTVVYGFFALITVTPALKQTLIPGLSSFNALSAGLVMGVMILPIVASLSEDALSAVPRSLREGAFGLGATRFEVASQVVVRAALSGIMAALILAFSRAVGETMIVAIAAGQNPKFTLDITVPIQTMTSYIVQVSLGDTPYGSLGYYTIYAVGLMLFLITFTLNVFSMWFIRRYREVY